MKEKLHPHNDPDLREYNLRIKKRSISPCTIAFGHGMTNEVTWNEIKLAHENPYWFSIEGIVTKVGDRVEIFCMESNYGEVVKMVTLEVLEIREKSIRLLELARHDFRTKEPELNECPTCHREL